jgi:hypothetical protein
MARLTGPPDRILELHPVSYQFAQADNKWDANWLIVRMTVADGPRQWSAIEPAFLTWELARLVEWFRKLADAEPDAHGNFDAIEPNLHFEAMGCGDAAHVRALFSHEFHPEWQSWRGSGRRYDLRDVGVEFEPGAAALRRFADELEQELMLFPERFTGS